MDATSILVVAPDDTLQALLPDLLQAVGYHVEVVASCRAALHALQRRPPALLLLHIDAADAGGRAFVAQVRAAHARRLPIVILGPRYEAAALAQALEADAWLPMPFDLDNLYAVVARLTQAPSATP